MRLSLSTAVFLSFSALFIATPAAAQFGGEWQGNFQERWLCGTGNFTAPGAIRMTLVQTGNDVAGTATYVSSVDNCLIQAPITYSGISVTGTVSGKTLTGHFGDSASEHEFIATLAVGPILTWKLTHPDPTDYFLDTRFIRPSKSDGASVSSFTATPASVASGGTTQLRWITNNARLVSISGGTFSTPTAVTGLALATPTATTTYTLKVTGQNGVVVSRTVTVTVP